MSRAVDMAQRQQFTACVRNESAKKNPFHKGGDLASILHSERLTLAHTTSWRRGLSLPLQRGWDWNRSYSAAGRRDSAFLKD